MEDFKAKSFPIGKGKLVLRIAISTGKTESLSFSRGFTGKLFPGRSEVSMTDGQINLSLCIGVGAGNHSPQEVQ